MNDKIIDFLNNQINIDNSVKHISDLLYEASRYYDTKIKNDIDNNITVKNYLQYTYIDLLIKEHKAPKELKDIFNKYLLLCKKYGELAYKQLMLDKEEEAKEMSILYELISYLENFLNSYGVLTLEVDYSKIINDQIDNYKDYLPSWEDCQKVLKKINKAD